MATAYNYSNVYFGMGAVCSCNAAVIMGVVLRATRTVRALDSVSNPGYVVSNSGGFSGGGLRGLQSPVSESSSAENVCLSTPISLLLNAAYTEPRGVTPSLFCRAGEGLVIAGVLPVLLCILNREVRVHATPFYSLAEPRAAQKRWRGSARPVFFSVS